MALEIKDGYVVDATPAVAPEVIVTKLDELLSALPGFGLLTPGMKNDALQGALVPDENNVWPGKPGYMESYDVYFAAYRLLAFLQAQPVVRQSSSEGTSVSVDAPNWAGLTAYYRSQSRILGGASQDVLQVVPIPGGPHVQRNDMSGGWGHGDIDTDVS